MCSHIYGLSHVIHLAARSQIQEAVTSALQYTTKTSGQTPRLIASDNAPEYYSQATVYAVQSIGTHTAKALPYNPEANGVAERLNRAFLNGTRCIIATARVQEAYWPYAVSDNTFKQGLLTHSSTGPCPFSEWKNKNVQLPKMVEFGQNE